jgi:hypothetical protein
MVRNRATNDEDFVPPTKYPKLSRRMKEKPPPAPKPLPYFKTLPIRNKNTCSTPKLPHHVDSDDPH